MKKSVLFIAILILAFYSFNEAQDLIEVSNFEGIQWNSKLPPDPNIAVGLNFVVFTINNKMSIYDRNGSEVSSTSLLDFFSSKTPPGEPYDPRIVYDNFSNRWILFALSRPSGSFSTSNYLIAVSQSSDPTAGWYYYKFDAKIDNGTSTYNHADYTGLGYNNEAIYITSNQIYDYGTSGFQYAKIKAIKKSDLYNGESSPANHDFINMKNADGSNVESIQPVQQFGSTSKFYLMNTSTNSSSNFITIWSITNPFDNNRSILRESTVIVGNYDPANDAVQKSSTTLIETFNARISNCIFRGGFLYGSFHIKNSWSNGSAVKYFRVNSSDYTLDINSVIEAQNVWYYYPELFPDAYGNLIIMFNESSSNDFVGIAWTYRLTGHSDIGEISFLKAGEGTYDNINSSENRWGDFNGACFDPVDNKQIWIYGEFAKSNNIWGTWAGAFKFNPMAVTTYFTNKFSTTNLGGSFHINNNPTPLNSGDHLTLFQGDNFAVTDNERFANWNNTGANYKHNNWNLSSSEFKLFHNFTANFGSQQYQDANYSKMEYAKIDIKTDELLSGDGKFLDPWYVLNDGSQPGNYWKDFFTSYEPNGEEGASEKGIFLNQGTDWQSPCYSVQVAQSLRLDGITHSLKLLNWDYNPAKIDVRFLFSYETQVVFKSSDAILTAKLKGSQLSNNSKAYTNCNQRKIVRVYTQDITPPGYILHSVYESMGHVWYETSTNNGQTWQIMNECQPLDTYGAKSPSIDNYYDRVLITWQEKYPPTGGFRIKLATIIWPDIDHLETVMGDDDLSYDSFDANPVVATTNNNYGLVIWKGAFLPGGNGQVNLKFMSGFLVGGSQFATYGTVPETDINASNPSVYARKEAGGGPQNFHLAYQQSNKIYYNEITWNISTHDVSFSNPRFEVSSHNGFSRNYNPSIIGCNNNSNVKICWTAYRSTWPTVGGGWEPLGETKVFFRSKDNGIWSVFKSYGNVVNSANINRNNDNSFAFAWSELNPKLNKFVRSDNLNSFHTTNTTGTDLQVCNYDNLDNMSLNSFSISTVPYSFKLSNTFNLYPQIGEEIFTDREGIVLHDTTAFHFSFGEILVDSLKIDFKVIPDTVVIDNKEKLNTYLTSVPFNLNDNSAFIYGIKYGVTDSISAAETLTQGKYINFKVELIDDQTNEVICIFDDVTFSVGNITPFAKFTYQIDPEGIGNRTCRLILITDDNLDYNYSLTKDYKASTNLAKKNYIRKSFKGNEIVKFYNLFQNYPNPFNPITTINYQLPQTGLVTLKVYDILGAEVTTLVDEQKTQGRYSVNFDASTLASGVYIYQIRANDYVSSRKMLLVK